MGDIPPWLGDKLWPASRFIGYRPDRLTQEGKSDDPAIRGRFLPRFIYHSDKHYISSKSRALAKVREHPITSKILNIFQSFIGAFVGVALVAVMARSQPFLRRRAPVVVGSFGAEAVLLYASHTSPLVQPRNIMIGNCLSAVIGIAIAKGFTQLDRFTISDNGDYNWAACALAIACAIAAMQIFNVTHPPGGATAVLAVSITAIHDLDWFYVAQMAGASGIMLAWGLVINNIGKRRYPTFWISPRLVEKVEESKKRKNEKP